LCERYLALARDYEVHAILGPGHNTEVRPTRNRHDSGVDFFDPPKEIAHYVVFWCGAAGPHDVELANPPEVNGLHFLVPDGNLLRWQRLAHVGRQVHKAKRRHHALFRLQLEEPVDLSVCGPTEQDLHVPSGNKEPQLFRSERTTAFRQDQAQEGSCCGSDSGLSSGRVRRGGRTRVRDAWRPATATDHSSINRYPTPVSVLK
jgi:hypothetical protein